MSSYRGTLYTGVTNDLARRVYEHRHKLTGGFTDLHNVSRLVYFEETPDVNVAIAREKQIKRWRRNKKVTLIEGMNPSWETWQMGGVRTPAAPDPSTPLGVTRGAGQRLGPSR